MIEAKLAQLTSTAEGQFLLVVGVDPVRLKPMVKPFVLSLSSELAPAFLEVFDPEQVLNVDRLRHEVLAYMQIRLEELTPDRVTSLIKDVIYNHLGWLVVYGVFFGGVLGVVSEAAGVAPNY